MKQLQPNLLKLLVAFYLLAFSSCHQPAPALPKGSITISETYAPEDLLPRLAFIDLSYDTSSTAEYLKLRKTLLGTTGDTMKVDVVAYLKKHIQLSLFKKLLPNQRTVLATHPEESSYIGFCLHTDTVAVNDILLRAKAFRTDEKYEWIPFRATFNNFFYYHLDPDEYSALVVYKPQTKVIHLSSGDLENVEVTSKKASHFWQLPGHWLHEPLPDNKAALNQKEDSALVAAFPETAILLVKFQTDRQVYYCSGSREHILERLNFGYTEN